MSMWLAPQLELPSASQSIPIVHNTTGVGHRVHRGALPLLGLPPCAGLSWQPASTRCVPARRGGSDVATVPLGTRAGLHTVYTPALRCMPLHTAILLIHMSIVYCPYTYVYRTLTMSIV